MTTSNLERIIGTAVELWAAKTLETLGITSGELSQRRTLEVYGTWAKRAIQERRLLPCRIEEGHRATMWYRGTDILRLKTIDAARAELRQHSNTL